MQVKSYFTQAALAGALLVAVAMPGSANDDGAGFFVTPEALYFSFTENNFDYATVGPFEADEIDGDVKRIDDDYEFGWRLGLGFRWNNDWDFTARWTHLDVQSEAQFQATGDDYLFLNHDPFEYEDYFFNGFADAQADQNLDYLDLTVGRTFTSDNGHSARFFAGVRWANFDQNFDVAYIDNDDAPPDADNAVYTTEMDSDYTGWGFVVGAEGHLGLGEKKEWSFFGSVGVALLMGDTDQHRRDIDWDDFEDFEAGTFDPGDVVIDVDDNFDSTSTVIEAQLGVEWARQFDSVRFGIRWGWEIQHWAGIGTLAHYLGYDQQAGRQDGDGDIGVMGAFVRASWAW